MAQAQMKVTKCVTIRTLKPETVPSSPEKWDRWVNCFSVTSPKRQALHTISEWDEADTSHVLLDIDVPNQQLYHLPMLVTPIFCIYLVAFDLRSSAAKQSLGMIHNVMKNVYTLSSYRRESGNEMPVVFLVGMHADEANDRSKFTQELKERLEKMPYNGLISKPVGDEPFWAVNGEDLSVSGTDLSREIQSCCSRHGFEVRRWIRYHHKLQEELKNVPCILYDDLKAKMAAISPNDDIAGLKFDAFLKFLHNYGFIFYHSVKEGEEADKVVLVQPQYLCRLFDVVLELKEKRERTTIHDLFSRTDASIDSGANHKQWFQRICIDLGLVVKVQSDFVFVIGLKAGTPNSPPPAEYSVPPLLMTFKGSNQFSVEPEYLLPSFFFAVFVTEFLSEDRQYEVMVMEQHYVRIKNNTTRIHLVEQDFCIEIGIQELEVDSWEPIPDEEKIEDLQSACIRINKNVVRSADIILRRLKLAETSIRYGFYHTCGKKDAPAVKTFAAYKDGKRHPVLECSNCAQRATPLQEIWFRKKDDLEKMVSVQTCPLSPSSDMMKLELCARAREHVRRQSTPPSPLAAKTEHVRRQSTPPSPPAATTAEQVLGKFRDQFIRDLNADAIVYGLKDKNIIADGTVEAIRQESSQKLKNEILHDHLVRTCTERALKKVCDIIMAVQGNPKMAELGEDMKSMLAGQST